MIAAGAAILAARGAAVAAPPTGFTVESVGSGWNELVGVNVLPDGRAIAWERGGRLWMIDADGTKHSTPMLDISEEVGAWRDHGMLGVALHPNFLVNGKLYLLYVVDRHHLLFTGTPRYDPGANEFFAASIGRVTRYIANAASGFSQVDPASRTVLLGESITTGIPITHDSHGVGSIHFGEDGTLLVSTGDSASYDFVDVGGQLPGGYVNQALADGILRPSENVGSFRAQLVDSLCGKILRLDAETGDGLPSNPFFDAAAPRAPRSRVWCLGLRNPCRFEIVPDTGSHHPGSGDPGTLVIGDVGWTSREEVNVATTGGLDFGWPIFEGLDWTPYYALSTATNPDAPNPLFGGVAAPCPSATLPFTALLADDSLDPASTLFVNPCSLHQAEHAIHSGPVFVDDVPGFTGTGYLEFQNPADDYVEWRPTIPAAGSWTIHIRYALGAAESRPLRITVDGAVVHPSLDFPSTGSWSHPRWTTVTVHLDAGERHIRATAIGASGPNIDALAVVPAAEPLVSVPDPIPTFTHHRPVIDWSHSGEDAQVPGFVGQVPTGLLIGTPESGVTGAPFQGYCAIGGSRVEVGPWPSEWHGVHLFGDWTSLFIRGFRLNAEGRVDEVKVFDPLASSVVFARYDPHRHALWVVRWGDQLVRIRYAPGTNEPPVIAASASPSWGPSPLAVTFDASASFDPESTALTFTWTFPDGSRPTDGAVVQHVFTGSGTPEHHQVLLTVRDADGLESSTIVHVWTDNTPPAVEITSVHDGDLYSMKTKSVIPLEAVITDAEHAHFACTWVTTLHHNEHVHPEPPDPACSTSTVISPLGCGEETYFFSISLTATDPLGLSTTETVSIHPDCGGASLCKADLNGDRVVDGNDFTMLFGAWGSAGEKLIADVNGDGIVDVNDLTAVLGAWGPCP